MAHWKARDQVTIDEIAPALYRISAMSVSKKGVKSRLHSYFLAGVRGGVLFHGPDRVPFYREHAAFFDERGGIGLQALTHGGDASRACAHVEKTFGAPVWVNRWELDQARLSTRLPIERGFENDEPLAAEVEGIHLPGHSVGFTVFRFATGGHSYLVCGHAIGQTAGADGWASGVHPLMAETALRSLHVLRDLDADYLLPDRTRREPEPPLPFGPSERAPITEKVRAYLVKKHHLGKQSWENNT